MRALPYAIVTACALLVPAVAFAQQHPNLERGFAAEKVYQFGDLDNVNLFNGNVNVSIPIGQEYTVGGKVSYRLGLSYNSKAWDIEERGFGGQVLTQALPNRRSNAGLGWQVSLGKLVPPGDPTNNSNPIGWLYVSPDGAEHVLYGTLHNGEAGTPGYKYTRSGTYLRLKDLPSPLGGWHDLEFGDGTIHRFDNLNRLREIRDWLGNRVDVTYPDATTWKIADGWREHFVRFAVVTAGEQPVVTEVDLAAFGGQRAVYQFNYFANTELERPPKDPLADKLCYDDDPETSAHVNVSLLEGVTLPDGPDGPDGSGGSRFVFGYYLDDPSNVCRAGALGSLRLPTLGSLEWEYATRTLPVEGCYPEYIDYWATRSPGVSKRRQLDSSGDVLGEWEYVVAASASPPPAPGDDTCGAFGQFLPPEEWTTTVVTPLKDRTVHYFSTWPNRKDSINGFERRDYGLPFTRLQPGVGDLFLSQQMLDCDAEGSNCSLERSEYVRYEHDESFNECRNDLFQECMDRNRRAAATRTVFETDLVDGVSRWAGVDHSDFNGLGRYRTSTTSGNFDSGNERTSHVAYTRDGQDAHDSGTYPGPTWEMWPSGLRWVIDTFEEQSDSEGGATAKKSFDVDPATGLVRRMRIHKASNGTLSTTDVIVVNEYDARGDLEFERFYGGDTQPVNTGSDLETLALPASPTYHLAHTTSSGTRATTAYVSNDLTVSSFKALDCGDDPATGGVDPGIDASTGLPSKCRDTSRIATSYEYDRRGRLVWEKPEAGHDGWTEYVYTPATALTLAAVTVKRWPNGGGAPPQVPLAQSGVLYDRFGRVTEEHQTRANGNPSARQTLYNAMGWRTSVSEQGNTAKKTQFLDYDAFGRPGKIRPPDDNENHDHDVTFTYEGIRTVERSVKVATSLGPEVTTTVTSFNDRQGRLYRVREAADYDLPGTPRNTTTTYGYDVGNRLVSVSHQNFPGTQTQTRSFNYDQRGFLLSEQHPEKGGNVVTYSQYDARGHVGRKQDGPFDITFDYDDAERLTLVRESGPQTGPQFVNCTNNGGRRCLKTFTYGTSNVATQRTNGRLQQASRFNHVGAGYNLTVEVIETYTYAERQGRVSRKNTAINLGGSPGTESWRQTYTYDPLGNVSNLGYPDCTWAGCPSSPRTVSHFRSHGWLTSIPSFANTIGSATTISYHPNGAYDEITHGNGVVDKQSNDPNSMRRPRELSSRASANYHWRSGLYEYDGAGNVKRMGGSYFLYDRVSRVVDGHVQDGASGGGPLRYQTYAYDPFGNLRAIGGDPWAAGRETPTSATTNRLNGSSYDQAGNLTGWNGSACGSTLPSNPCYEYDAFGMVTRYSTGNPGKDWRYIYTADDERFWSVGAPGISGGSIWTLRDLDGKILREYEPNAEANWSRFRDYVYRDGQLLASAGKAVTPYFSDVPAAHWAAAEIEAVRAAGITAGCGGSAYCPNDPVNRAQMAVFIITASSAPGYQPPACNPATAHFTDVPCSYWAARWIYDLYHRGITAGCTPTAYCPTGLVTKSEMSVFTLFSQGINPPPCTSASFSDYTCSAGYAKFVEEAYRRGIDVGCSGNGTTAAFCPNEPLTRAKMAVFMARGFGLPFPADFPKYYHLDHLGTPRAITSNATTSRLAYHAYFPFGEELTSTTQDLEQKKFTGHERDFSSPASVADDLDYMHARFYNPQTGRFLSTDPVGGSPNAPQSWNRYAYVQGNPMKYTDPTGEITAAVIAEEIQTSLEGLKQEAMNAVSTGGVGGVAAATAVGFSLDLVSTAADVLKAGSAVGTAIGSGAGAGETALAIGQDALRTAGLVAPLAGVGRSVASRATVELVHFTDDAGRAAIQATGNLRAGTYVTRASEVRGLSARQIESKLEILPGRGEHSFTARTTRGNLAIPENGARTSGGAYQRQLKTACAASPSSCAL